MALRRSPEEKAQRQAEQDRAREEAAAAKRAEQIQREEDQFWASPAGQARIAYDEGDHVFQCHFDVMSQEAVIVVMVGSTTRKQTTDPTDILNSVCREGWELITGSFVFVEEGSQSRDKFMSSGQNIAVKGRTMGYYLFRRCEANLGARIDPWKEGVDVASLGANG